MRRPDAMSDFKVSSITFQKGQLSAMAYLTAFREAFGDTAARLYFSELMLLLPDEDKRVELQCCFDAFSRSAAAPPAAVAAEWAKRANKQAW